MKIGISTANFYPDINTEDVLGIYREKGFDTVETFLNTFSEMEEDYAKRLRERCDELGIVVNSIHVMSNVMEPSLFDRQKRRRDDFVKIFKSSVKAAKILGTDIYTFHGPNIWMGDQFPMSHIADCYDRIIYEGLAEGVHVAQENVAYQAAGNPDWLRRLVEKVRFEMKFTFDIKQARRIGRDPEEFFDIMGKNIINVHLNDNDENNVCLLPGRGKQDFSYIYRRLEELDYKGNGIIEVYRDNFKDENDLKNAREYLEGIKNDSKRNG